MYPLLSVSNAFKAFINHLSTIYLIFLRRGEVDIDLHDFLFFLGEIYRILSLLHYKYIYYFKS